MAERRMSTGSDILRATREEERVMLSKLNARLEHFIARLRELESENDRLELKLTQTQDSSARQEASLRERYEREIHELQGKAQADQKLIIEHKNRSKELAAQLAEAQKVGRDGKNALQRMQEMETELATVKARHATLEGHHAAEKARADDLAQKLAVAEATAASLEQKVAPLQEQLAVNEEYRRSEAAAYRDQIAELKAAHAAEVDAQREGFERQLEDALSNQRALAEQEREELKASLTGHASQVEEELTRAVAEERKARKLSEEAAKQSKASLDKVSEQAAADRKRVRSLEDERAAMIASHEAMVADLQKDLEAVRAERDEKAEIVNALYAESAQFSRGLKTYDKLLDAGEAKLGISPGRPSSSKKRRLAPSGPSVFVARLDLAQDCFTVRNAGDAPQPMSGWKVRSIHSEKLAFKFPADFVLGPDEAVTVWSGANSKKRAKDEGDGNLHWSTRHMWKDEGDSAQLFDPEGSLVSQLDAEANSVAEALAPPESAAGAEGSGAGSCAIM